MTAARTAGAGSVCKDRVARGGGEETSRAHFSRRKTHSKSLNSIQIKTTLNIFIIQTSVKYNIIYNLFENGLDYMANFSLFLVS